MIDAFRRSTSLYESLVEEVRFSLQAAFASREVRVAALLGRVKSVTSLEEKLQRKNYDTLESVPDLAGVRVVTLFDVETRNVLELIRQHFTVIEEHGPDEALGIDKMGYVAHHLIVILGSQRYAGPRYNGVRNLRCEIQVRTAIQDAWALVSHNLAYKQEKTIPPSVLRRLNKVSALLEVAQDVFESVRESREEYARHIRAQQEDPESFLRLPVDSDTLMAYTRKLLPELPISDNIHALLMRDLDLTRYRTLGDVDALVQSALPRVREYARTAPELFRFGTDYITKSFGLGDLAFRARHPFGTHTRRFFDERGVKRHMT